MVSLNYEEVLALLPVILALNNRIQKRNSDKGSYLNDPDLLEEIHGRVIDERFPLEPSDLAQMANWLFDLPVHELLCAKLVSAVSTLNSLLSEPYNYS